MTQTVTLYTIMIIVIVIVLAVMDDIVIVLAVMDIWRDNSTALHDNALITSYFLCDKSVLSLPVITLQSL